MKTTIRTSDASWLETALVCYTGKKPFEFLDDAGLGITEKDLASAISLIRAAKKTGLTLKQVLAALAGVGITGVGVWIIFAAIADPDPTSKLGLLIAGGIVLALTGALGTLASLGVKFSVSAKGPGGTVIVVKPEQDA